MSEELPHIDAEAGFRLMVAVAIGLPAAQIGGWPTGTDVVALEDKLPYVSVSVGGGDQNYFQATPIIDVDVFASTVSSTKTLTEDLSLYFLRYPQSVVVGGRVFMLDNAEVTIPQDMPWEDPKIRRRSVTIQATVRR